MTDFTQLKTFALSHVIEALQKFTQANMHNFVYIAETFLGILIAIEFIKEAIKLANGEGFSLPNKVIMWVFVMVMIYALYNGFGDGIYSTAKAFAGSTFDKFQIVLERYFENCTNNASSTGFWSGLWNTVSHPVKTTINGIAVGMAVLIGALCIVMIYVMILGVFGSIALLILLGPVAFAFMASETFRDIGIRWINSIITNLLMIIIYGVILEMVGEILSATLKAANDKLTAANLAATIIVMLIGPIVALSLVQQGPKTVMSLLGGSAGGGEWGAMIVAGMAAMGAKSIAKMGIKKTGGGGGGSGGGKGGAGGGESGGSDGGGSAGSSGSDGSAGGGGNSGAGASSKEAEGAKSQGGGEKSTPQTKGQKLKDMAKKDLKSVGKAIAKAPVAVAKRLTPNFSNAASNIYGAAKPIGQRLGQYAKTLTEGVHPKDKPFKGE